MSILHTMQTQYTLNSKNRKFKKQFFSFFARIGFGAGKLPISGRFIILLILGIGATLFFPWLEMHFGDKTVQTYSAFSEFMGYIGYGIIISIVIILFFLLSHTRKERVRAYMPFRLSDTQAIVFVVSMVLVALFEIILVSRNYNQIALEGAYLTNSFFVAITFIVLVLFSGFFLSQSTKAANTDMYYLNHDIPNDLGEYQDLLYPGQKSAEANKKKNMSLPI